MAVDHDHDPPVVVGIHMWLLRKPHAVAPGLSFVDRQRGHICLYIPTLVDPLVSIRWFVLALGMGLRRDEGGEKRRQRDDDGEDDETRPAEAETPQPGGRPQHGPANGFRYRRHRKDAGVRGEERSRMHPFRLESQLLYHQSPYIWCMRRVVVCIPCYTYSIGDGYCDLYPRHSGHTSAGRSGPPRAAPLMCLPSQTANDCTTLWHHQNPAQPPPLQGAGEDSTIHAIQKTS